MASRSLPRLRARAGRESHGLMRKRRPLPASPASGGGVAAFETRREMHIIDGDFGDARVLDLLRIHLTNARAQTAPGSAHALDVSGLQATDISFWTIWDGDTLLGCGALKRLAADHGEVKSMHTV